jgi:opacity protein-like surface antigen
MLFCPLLSNILMRATLLATASLFCLHPAQAGEVALNQLPPNTVSTVKAMRQHGAYWSAFAGPAFDFSASGAGAYGNLSADDEGGWIAGIKAGYSFETPGVFRPAAEIELSYLDNELRGSNGRDSFRGDLFHLTLMANAILGIDMGELTGLAGFSGFRPYIGAGVGVAYSSLRGLSIEENGRSRSRGDSSGSSLAYQFIGGLEYQLSEYVSLFTDYRYFVIDDIAGGEFGEATQDLWTVGVKINY